MLASIEAKFLSKMPKLSVDQKRLELLRQQLYGKEKPLAAPNKPTLKNNGSVSGISNQPPVILKKEPLSETGYLKKDLTKILILSTLVLVIQFSLFFAVSKNLINLKFF